jgi:hypothetical protein
MLNSLDMQSVNALPINTAAMCCLVPAANCLQPAVAEHLVVLLAFRGRMSGNNNWLMLSCLHLTFAMCL